MKPKLAEVEFFSATTDLWTSQAKHLYLSLTVHSCSLHSSQNIAEAIVDVLGNWGFDTSKLVATTTDNVSNLLLLSTAWIGFKSAVLAII